MGPNETSLHWSAVTVMVTTPAFSKTGAIAALSSEMPFSADFVRVLLLLMN